MLVRIWYCVLFILAFAGFAQAQQADPVFSIRGSLDGEADELAPQSIVPIPETTTVQTLPVEEVGQEASGRERAQQGARRSAEPIQALTRTGAPVFRRTLQSEVDNGVFGGETDLDRPTGLRVGNFEIFPELRTGGGWTNNVQGVAGGDGGSFYRIAPSVRAVSDWSRHQLSLSLRGSYQGFPENQDDNDLIIGGDLAVRLDLNDFTIADIAVAYEGSPESRSSFEVDQSDITTPFAHDIAANAALTREIGLIDATLRGGVDRSFFTGGETSSGSSIDNQGRNNTVLLGTARLRYGRDAILSPFAEVTALTRLFDQGCDDNSCQDRNAPGYALRGGLVIDRGAKLTGELGVGWRSEHPEASDLDPLQGVTLDGSLIWSPSRLTTVSLTGTTDFDSTTITDSSGSILYSGGMTVQHSLTRNIALDSTNEISWRDYQGIDQKEMDASTSVGLTWAFARYMALETRYTHRWFNGSDADDAFQSDTIEAGVRIRR
ncbi:MAG: outer membrane beta-barrel protein [Stappiaceae bacterium]